MLNQPNWNLPPSIHLAIKCFPLLFAAIQAIRFSYEVVVRIYSLKTDSSEYEHLLMVLCYYLSYI